MADIKVDLERRKIMVRPAGMDEASILLKLPSRRWMQKHGIFVVPATRMNCERLFEAHGAGRIQIQPEPLAYIAENARGTTGDRKFPDWYAWKTAPFPPQREAIAKTYRNDAIALFMRMGTGKSKVIIDTATALFYERRIQAAILFMPVAVKAVWMGPKGQLAEHSPSPFVVINVDSSFDWANAPPMQDRLFWLLVGIESMSQGRTYDMLMPYLEQYKCFLGVDESSRIKNPTTIRTKRLISLGTRAKVKLISTGTPATKNLIDLYSQFEFLDPNIIGCGDVYAFKNRYCIMGGYKRKDIVGYDNVDELMGLIEPYTYRCDKPKGMPEQTWAHRNITLCDEQKEMYRKLKKGEIGQVKVANILNRIAKLQEVVGGFLREDPHEVPNPLTGKVKKVQGKIIWQLPPEKNPKIMELHNQMEELGDEQIIVWCKYLWEIEMVKQAMAKHGTVATMIGETDDQTRIEVKDRFQAGGIRTLVSNQQIGGLGHTFTASHLAYYYSNTDNLEDRLQSEDRIHRRGQDENCLYTDLLAEGTVDYTIYASIGSKKDLDLYVKEKLDQAVNIAAVLEELLGNV
jgi:hypothetical protein